MLTESDKSEVNRTEPHKRTLHGQLKDTNIIQILTVVNLAHKTGRLTVEGPTETAQISFRDGRLLYAQVGSEHPRLESILRRAGKLTEEQSQGLRNVDQNVGDKALAHYLYSAGYVSQQDILRSVQNHIQETVYRLLTWEEGHFYFEADLVPPSDYITVPTDLQHVIEEGTRRLRHWEELVHEIPSLDVALKFVDRPNLNVEALKLNEEAWRIVPYINPSNSIRDIARASNMSEVEIRRVVHGLLLTGLVRILSVDSRSPSATAKRKPAGSASGKVTGWLGRVFGGRRTK